MKILQKATLAAAIAAVPFLSANAMQPMDDAFLSDVTGQAGVTIETSVNGEDAITIGSITYTDTDAGGNLVIQGDIRGTGNGIAISGGSWDDATGTFTEGGSYQRQTIDIDGHGNLITETTAIDAFGGAVKAEGTARRIEVGEVLLRADGQNTGGAQLASNLEMVQISGASSAHILNLSQTNSLADYQGEAHAIGANLSNIDADAKIAIVTKGESRIANLSVDALDGAVGIRDLSYGSGADGTGMIESTQVIWAINGDASVAGSKAGIYIQGSDSVGTLKIGALELGQNSIGSIAITNLKQSGSITRIYGH